MNEEQPNVSHLLDTKRKERCARFDPQEAFNDAYEFLFMAADLLEKSGATKVEQLKRDDTAKLAEWLRGASAAATALDAWMKGKQ